MRVTNTTRGDLGLATGQIVPAGGSIDIAEKDLKANEGSEVVKHYFNSGMLVGVSDEDLAEAAAAAAKAEEEAAKAAEEAKASAAEAKKAATAAAKATPAPTPPPAAATAPVAAAAAPAPWKPADGAKDGK